MAENDTECPASLATELGATLESAGILSGIYTILEKDHLFFVDGTASEYTDLLLAEVASVEAGTVVIGGTPFFTDVTITEEDDDDDGAFNGFGLMTLSAVAFALLQVVF